MGQIQQLAGSISDKENQERLQNQRKCNQHNVQGIFQNHFALSHENQNQCEQLTHCSSGVKFMDEHIFKILCSPAADHKDAGQNTACQWNDHKQHHA